MVEIVPSGPVYIGSLHWDRLDQARVIVLNVADPRAYRPAFHLFRRIWGEKGL